MWANENSWFKVHFFIFPSLLLKGLSLSKMFSLNISYCDIYNTLIKIFSYLWSVVQERWRNPESLKNQQTFGQRTDNFFSLVVEENIRWNEISEGTNTQTLNTLRVKMHKMEVCLQLTQLKRVVFFYLYCRSLLASLIPV